MVNKKKTARLIPTLIAYENDVIIHFGESPDSISVLSRRNISAASAWLSGARSDTWSKRRPRKVRATTDTRRRDKSSSRFSGKYFRRTPLERKWDTGPVRRALCAKHNLIDCKIYPNSISLRVFYLAKQWVQCEWLYCGNNTEAYARSVRITSPTGMSRPAVACLPSVSLYSTDTASLAAGYLSFAMPNNFGLFCFPIVGSKNTRKNYILCIYIYTFDSRPISLLTEKKKEAKQITLVLSL